MLGTAVLVLVAGGGAAALTAPAASTASADEIGGDRARPAAIVSWPPPRGT
jgi:hypothetical protein